MVQEAEDRAWARGRQAEVALYAAAKTAKRLDVDVTVIVRRSPGQVALARLAAGAIGVMARIELGPSSVIIRFTAVRASTGAKPVPNSSVAPAVPAPIAGFRAN